MRQDTAEWLSAFQSGFAPNDFLHPLIGLYPRASRFTPARGSGNRFFESELIRQFMLESLLLNSLALLAALILAFSLNRSFALLAGKPLDTIFTLPPVYWVEFMGVFLVGTFLSGLYPAIILSGYQPVKVLKGAFKNSTRGQWVRKSLIVGQFATSVVLIAGTIVVYRQVSFMRSQRLGANID